MQTNNPHSTADVLSAAASTALAVSSMSQAAMASRGMRRINALARVPAPLALIAADANPQVAAATAAAAFAQPMMLNTVAPHDASWNLQSYAPMVSGSGPRSPQGAISGGFPANVRRTSLGNSGLHPTMLHPQPTSAAADQLVSQVMIPGQQARAMPPLRPRARPQVYHPQHHVRVPVQQGHWAPGQSAPVARGPDAAHLHPQFRTKAVCSLTCRHCSRVVCQRGMKAILLADTRVELYSTDMPLKGAVQLIHQDYVTSNCHCRIRDVACLGCGNCIGYHVTQACETCLDACNNGHFWMFHSDGVMASDRIAHDGKAVLWGHLPSASMRAPEAKNLHSRSNTGSCEGPASNEQIRLALLNLDEHLSVPCLNEPGASAAHEHWIACH